MISALVVIFLGTLIAFSIWTVGDVFTQIHLALISPLPQSAGGFDITNAAKLDWRGLVNGAPSMPISTSPSTSTIGATSTAP